MADYGFKFQIGDNVITDRGDRGFVAGVSAVDARGQLSRTYRIAKFGEPRRWIPEQALSKIDD